MTQDIKIIVTLANILKTHNVMQLQGDKTLKIYFLSKKLKQITEYNKSTGRQKNKSMKENKLMKIKLLNEYTAKWRDVSAISFGNQV